MMTSSGPKAQGKSIKRAALTGRLLQPELSSCVCIRLERFVGSVRPCQMLRLCREMSNAKPMPPQGQ